jgi:hypothetical protein
MSRVPTPTLDTATSATAEIYARIKKAAGKGPSECFAMIIERCLLSLSLALFIGVAAAQTPPGPIVDGRRPQPTQQQVDSKEDDSARQWHRGVQSEIDRLYDEVMRASAPRGR